MLNLRRFRETMDFRATQLKPAIRAADAACYFCCIEYGLPNPYESNSELLSLDASKYVSYWP
jgi:hypothetical protein